MEGKALSDFVIPVQPPPMEKVRRDYPITEGENLLRAFRHEKPMYVPCLYQATQFVIPKPYARGTQNRSTDCVDWFGTLYKHEPLQEGVTPIKPFPLKGVAEWRQMRWPEINAMDWTEGYSSFKRDENLAIACRCLGNGTFEQLHFSEGFEQCLIDMLTETEECRAFFERLTDFKIDLFNRQNDVYHYDYVCHNDDWSNAKNQFFSCELFEEALLEPSIRLSEAVRSAGCRYMLHSCGRMEIWLPYIVNDLKVDLVEIQSINNIDYILETYGDRLTVEYLPDPYIMYNPATTAEQAREYARSLVDRFGAHKHKGSGLVIRLNGNIPESHYAFEDELYNYSLKLYAGLQ
jgi:hypothetical protein